MNILVISPKNLYIIQRLKEEAVKAGVGLDVVSVGDLEKIDFEVDIGKYNALYVRNPYLNGFPDLLPKVVQLAKNFKAQGEKIVDAIIAEGVLGEGKWEDYQKLQEASLIIPKTTCLNHGHDLSRFKYPFILKWVYGFKAKDVFLVKNVNQLAKLLPLHPRNEWLIQEFIEADCEYKVITIGYRSTPMLLKFDIAKTGFGIKYPTGRPIKSADLPEVVSLAQRAAKLLGRELAKVDILYSQGKYYILEVNRFPGIKPFESLTKYNLAGEFLRYLMQC